MPVRFKGESEYDKHYKWISSPKSASFVPSVQQLAPVAGVTSPQHSLNMGFQQEPPLQRKKKPIPLITTSTTKMYSEDIVVPDDYMILGSQEKFASDNVTYKDYLTRNRDRVLGTTYVKPPAEDYQPVSPPLKPAPRIDFDTGARKPAKSKPSQTQVIKPRAQFSEAPQMEVRGEAQPVNPSKTRVIAKEPNSIQASPPKASTPRHDSNEDLRPQTKQPSPSAPPPKPSIQEPNKTRTKAPQDANVDADYVMKYRAGVAPLRRDPKRRSEYSYKYDWKDPVNSTPLLAAEQVVHSSNVPLSRPVRSQSEPRRSSKTITKNSEYQRQYKTWKSKPVVESQTEADENVNTKIKGSKLRRTLSDQNLTPDRRLPAGSPSKIHHDNARLTKSLNPQKPFFPHKRSVGWTSEYKSNFQPFASYEYEEGAWRNVAPPHLKYNQEEVNVVKSDQSCSWTAEVRELREKAYEYRRRSLGTHFSRVHVGQLIHNNSQIWDQESETGSTIDALDLQQPAKKQPARKQTDQKRPAGKPTKLDLSPQDEPDSRTRQQRQPRSERPTRHRLAWSQDGDRSTSASDSVRSIRSASSPSIGSEGWRVDEQTQTRQLVQRTENTKTGSAGTPDSGVSDTCSSTTENGRVQTPDLNDSQEIRRHHLDITTPLRRGLLLAGPSHKTVSSAQQTPPSNIERVYKVKQQTTPVVNARQDTRRPETRAPLSVKTKTQPVTQPELLSPTYGKPTPDTHVLLDDEMIEPVDELLETRFVQSPASKGRNLNTIREGAGATYKLSSQDLSVIRQRQRDDDEMSDVSILSVASSTSSRASELLERASKRKNFWKK